MLNLENSADRNALAERIKDDINKFCETYYKQGHRDHLGASELGEECWRKLWYKFRWVKQEKFDGRMLRLFNVGHQAEPRFIGYLRGIGFEVREFATTILNYHPESDDYFWSEIFTTDGLVEDVTDYPKHEAEALKRNIKPKQFRITGANGHYGGSLDGMCKAPSHYEINEELPFLNEFKTNATGSGYTDVEKLGLAKAKPKHFAQMSQYGYKLNLKYGIYLIENKNDSDITVKIVELDWNLGKQLEEKAESIINAKQSPPRISDNPSYYACKYCNFSDICHNNAEIEMNCRSCRQSKPIENAQWFCMLHNDTIPPDFIKDGCQSWHPL